MRQPRLKPETCSCRTWVVMGYCDLGVQTRCDPAPLDVQGEALAILTGRRLLEVVRIGAQWQLTSREAHRSVAALESPALRWPLGPMALADHLCHVPLPAAAPAQALFDLLDPPRHPIAQLDPPF